MRNHLLLALIFIQLSCAQKTKNRYLFSNVNIITMTDANVLVKKNILIEDGTIIKIFDNDLDSVQADNHIDLKGKYIMPSLADAHVHLPKNKKDLEKFLILNLINGVTKLRSMRGQWEHLQWRDEYNAKTSIYPKLYLSPPPISRKYDFTTKQLETFVKKAKEFDFIKILSVKNEMLFQELDSLCKINQIKIGGHFPSNVTDDYIFKSNYNSFEHLGGIQELSDLVENRILKIKKNDIYICPTLSWYSIGSGRYNYEQLRNQPGMQYISAEVIDNWINKTKKYRNKLGQQAYKEEVENELKKLDAKFRVIKRLNDLGIKMLLSPDSSSKYMISGFGMVGEMKLLKESGLSNLEILKMATVNFANFFNEDFETIETGRDADFIILNDNQLENLNSLKQIEGLFFNKNFLSLKALKELSISILPN